MSVRKLCPSLELKAQKELNEVPSRVCSDILAIREWLKMQPHLKSVNPSDQWIIGFLRGNKFSLERTKEKLDMYYTIRTVVPEFFQNRDPFDPIIQDILKFGCYLPLKICKTDDASRICITRFKDLAAKHGFLNIMKVSFMIFEIKILEDDNFIIAGDDVLADLEDAGLSLFIQWTPATARKVLFTIEKSLPVRLKSVHILHTPPGFEGAYAILKTFINDKFKRRFSVHSKINESVYQTFPRDILPKEYGGENGTVQELIDYWKAKVESYREWFLNEAEQRSDESLRPEEPKTSSSLFGVEGSFRKLEVD